MNEFVGVALTLVVIGAIIYVVLKAAARADVRAADYNQHGIALGAQQAVQDEDGDAPQESA